VERVPKRESNIEVIKMGKGKLIVIEGLDSSGKETQSKLLAQRLKSDGVNAIRVEFPDYQSESSALVKMYLSGQFGNKAGDVSPYVASTFYAADRFASYTTKWKGFYQGGGCVIADRYTSSNMIHQAGKIADSVEKERFLNWLEDFEFNLYKIPRPDDVIFMDMPPEVSIRLMQGRASKSGGADIHEGDNQHLFDSYNNAVGLCKKYGWHTVNCAENGMPRAVDAIAEDVYGYVKGVLGKE